MPGLLEVQSCCGAWVYRTGDGGTTWSPPLALPGAGTPQGFYASDAEHWWMVDGWGVMTTADGGKTWGPTREGWTPDVAMPVRILFADTTTAYAVDRSSRLFKTTDGGEHWRRIWS